MKLDRLYFNSHDENSKFPFGALKIGETVRFTIKDLNFAEHKSKFKDIRINILYFYPNNEYFEKNRKVNNVNMFEKKLIKNGEYYNTELSFDKTGLVFYLFSCDYTNLDGNIKSFYIGNSSDSKGGICLYSDKLSDITPYQITIYKERLTPSWYKKANFYQIFPDRFFNGNDNFMVNSPKENSFLYGSWYDTPMYIKNANGGIERWDFFGGNLKGIIKKLDYLEDLGITALYLNPIFKARSNHRYDTGDYHKIDEVLGNDDDFKSLINECNNRNIRVVLDGVFNHTGKDSKYFNIYNNYSSLGAYQSKESEYYNWYSFKNYPNTYECWWGIDDLPNVNEDNKSFREFILNDEDGVVPFWIKKGVSGWRLDVADELPDDFIEEIRTSMDKANSDTVLLGEVWEDATNKIAYSERRKYLDGNELNSVMNYPFKSTIIEYLIGNFSAEKIYRELMSIKENYPRESFYSNFNFLGTHDTKRIRTELNDDRLLKMSIRLLYTLPGVPSLYYGDEAGLTGISDPNNRKTYPWSRENKEILSWYKEMIKLRNSSECFVDGEFQPFFTEKLFGFFRYCSETVYVIIANNTNKLENLSLSSIKNNMDYNLLSKIRNTNLLDNIPINPHSVKIFKLL